MRRSVPLLGLLALVWLTATSGVFGGCTGLFRPATAERPPNGGIVVQNYSTEEAVLTTISAALAAKIYGQTAYIGAFAESTGVATRGFHAFHDPGSVQAWRQVTHREPPADWTQALELNFYADLVGLRATDAYSMQFEPDPTLLDEPGQDETTLHRHYTLISNAEDGSRVDTLAIGYADILLYRASAGRWAIFRWQDKIDPTQGVNPVNPDHLSMGARRLNTQ